ncbi:MAG: hypothetical protein CVU84_15215 [Firmicutes bacterium HGW-Firmicutes-1]|jgi:II/X family phage/plasmid replication protein|nr:MAG: hypothetical protein CVU84_15215 [Firmicutes bacterium HGW-Firmicutes-1]
MFDTVKIYKKIKLNTSILAAWKLHKGKKIIKYVKELKGITFTYYPETINNPVKNLLMASFSMPTLIYGSNVFMAYESDIPKLQKSFHLISKEIFGFELPNILYWQVSRLDYCYNFYVEQVDLIQKYIKILNKCKVPYFKNISYDTTAFFYNTSHSFKFYNKFEEIKSKLNNDNESTDENIEIIKPFSENLFRFEASIRRRKLLELFSSNKKGGVILKDILTDAQAVKIMEKYLQKIKIQNPLDLVKAKKIIQASIMRPTSKAKLLVFIDYLSRYGSMKAKEKYLNNYRTRIKDLKQLGLESFFISDFTDGVINFKLTLKTELPQQFPSKNVFQILLSIRYVFIYEDGG